MALGLRYCPFLCSEYSDKTPAMQMGMQYKYYAVLKLIQPLAYARQKFQQVCAD
jgi:hypothetical protein